MKLFSLLAAGASLVTAQDVITTTATDLNGHVVVEGPQRVESRTKTSSDFTERTRSINGREVPLERIEEHVLRDDSSGRTVERIIKRFDQTGRPGQSIKELVEETKTSGGSTVRRTTFETDINGAMRIKERATTVQQKSSAQETSETLVERPSLNGGFSVAAREEVSRTIGPNSSEEAITTYRTDTNGTLVPEVKIAKQQTKSGSQTTENVAEYEIGAGGQLRLHTQTIRSSVKSPDGSESQEIKILGLNAPGRTGSFDSEKLSLKEEQFVERRKAGGATVETLSVRRPTVTDPNQLGALQRISETTCRGKCEEENQ